MVVLVGALLRCSLMWTEQSPGLLIKQEDDMEQKAASRRSYGHSPMHASITEQK